MACVVSGISGVGERMSGEVCVCNVVRRMYRNPNAKQKLNKVSLGGEQACY